MNEAILKIDAPTNEIPRHYHPDDPQTLSLKARIHELEETVVDIPLIIGGEEVETGDLGTCVMPHDHGHVLARYHRAGPEQVRRAIEASREAWKSWSRTAWSDRMAIFLRAAELLAGRWRDTLNASTMLGQSKTVFQAEIDAACELIDFFRFNASFARQIYSEQPLSGGDVWNRLEWRPLEGFTLAISPFNFTSIAGNLPCAPAMMGNTVLWKPASSSVYSNYWIMKLLEEAGLPAGVINFIPTSGSTIASEVLPDPNLAGIHFTGSTEVFRRIWSTVGEHIGSYRSYPRVVGETGGKDFVFAHESADVDTLVCGLLRGAFEYQGQKCSAASRAYVPESIWDETLDKLKAQVTSISQGDPRDLGHFMGAVIDKPAFDRIKGYIDHARESSAAEIVCGGGCDESKGYFIEPTVVVTTDPHFKLMEEEIFGPVLTIYAYPDADYEKTLDLCDGTSPYGLTGAIFARDRHAIIKAQERLRFSAGNFYINDKPTGAVVGMQPFGGGRASGTNDKAGSMLNLLRWVTPRTIKETFSPPTEYRYPHMA